MKLKASLMHGETLDNCSNLTLFHINDGKVIGTSYFHKFGCNINVINYESKDRDFKLMVENGLYHIFGSLNNLELIEANEATIMDDQLLPRAIEYVKKKNIYCEQYKEDFIDEIDRKLGTK